MKKMLTAFLLLFVFGLVEPADASRIGTKEASKDFYRPSAGMSSESKARAVGRVLKDMDYDDKDGRKEQTMPRELNAPRQESPRKNCKCQGN